MLTINEGMVVSTRLSHSSISLLNIIVKTEYNAIYIILLDRYLEDTISPGMSITLKHSGNYFEHILDGTICEIDPSLHSLVGIHINKVREIVNTRMFRRYNTFLASSIANERDDSQIFSVITNLSLGGAGFRCLKRLPCSKEVSVKVFLPQGDTVSLRGRIASNARKNHALDYRMQFTEMEEKDSSILLSYFNTIELEIEKLRDSVSMLRDKPIRRSSIFENLVRDGILGIAHNKLNV